MKPIVKIKNPVLRGLVYIGIIIGIFGAGGALLVLLFGVLLPLVDIAAMSLCLRFSPAIAGTFWGQLMYMWAILVLLGGVIPIIGYGLYRKIKSQVTKLPVR